MLGAVGANSMTDQTPKPQQSAVAEPRSGSAIVPTPRPSELAGFLTALANKTLPSPWHLAMHGSAIDPQSFDPTSKTTSFP
jgi:hypothetical protein